jgi:hypothetical protein
MTQVKRSFLFTIALVIISLTLCYAQETKGWQLEKMPADLETDYALSALPPHLRDGATVYLLDPKKGYYIGKQGTNGFGTFINRTEWEWAEFVPDTYAAVSYDAEGVKTYLPVYFAVAEMRATGKYTPKQIRDTILKRVNNGTYKAPARMGLSYMLCPMLRTHIDEQRGIINNILPHYMFYAPRIDNDDIGGKWDGHNPFVINSGDILDKQHSIFNYIIVPAGDAEKASIIASNKNLIERLTAYKSYFKLEATTSIEEKEHQHH